MNLFFEKRYALRVSPAVTRLTVYRRLQVYCTDLRSPQLRLLSPSRKMFHETTQAVTLHQLLNQVCLCYVYVIV